VLFESVDSILGYLLRYTVVVLLLGLVDRNFNFLHYCCTAASCFTNILKAKINNLKNVNRLQISSKRMQDIQIVNINNVSKQFMP
jgi:hypothetical protein